MSGIRTLGQNNGTAIAIATAAFSRHLGPLVPDADREGGAGGRDARLGPAPRGLRVQPRSVRDFAAWSASTGNALAESSAEGGVYRFVFRKR
jgi:hypothetical protein